MQNMNRSYEWIMNHSGLPWLKLDINVPTEPIHQEFLKLRQSIGYQRGGLGIQGWRGAALHGLGSEKPRPHTAYGYKDEDQAPYQWTDAGEACPTAKQFILDNFPCNKFYRVKMNLLEPGGKLSPHVDARVPGFGITDPSPRKVRYVTVAVHWPREVDFHVGHYDLPIKTGDVYLIDFSNIHAVYSKYNKDRYSLIVAADFDGVKEWERLVERSYQLHHQDVLPKLNTFYFIRNWFLGSSRTLGSCFVQKVQGKKKVHY